MTVRETSSDHWDEGEFRAVFLQHYSRIVAILARMLGDRQTAEDLANDAFWRLYRQPELQANCNVGGWLYRTATNLGIDALRVANRRRKYEVEAAQIAEASTATDPLHDLLRQEKCRRVRAVLGSIKPSRAQILVLRTAGFSYKELAEALDVKLGGVGNILNRAEEEFRNCYLELNPDEEEI
jgi:RNA polymerase sigma factor (sigma-70 family)